VASAAVASAAGVSAAAASAVVALAAAAVAASEAVAPPGAGKECVTMSNTSPSSPAASAPALPSRWARLWRHLWVTDWQLRRALPPGALDHLQSTIGAGEELHTAQVRFIVEADLDLLAVWRGQTPRERALELFAQYHLWDTAANNGVLVYVQFADRAVEIIADRGCNDRVSASEWGAVARGIRDAFATGRYIAGAVAGLEVVSVLLARQFPRVEGDTNEANELPDRPVLL
jgi:uncharacterized membrane protein